MDKNQSPVEDLQPQEQKLLESEASLPKEEDKDERQKPKESCEDQEEELGKQDPTEGSLQKETTTTGGTGTFKAPLFIGPRFKKNLLEKPVLIKPKESENNSNKSQTKEKPSVEVQRKITSNVSPAEQLKQQQVPVPYKEPSWGSLCQQMYAFEVIKNGTVVESIDLKTKSFHVFGRLPSCDVTLEHPSLSRYHAIIQYCGVDNDRHEVGWYLYDLDSTHGTWVNKNKVKPRIFIRLRVGHVVKFGGSTRLYILQGPDVDQEAESDLSVTEIKQQRERQKKEAEVLRLAEVTEVEQDKLEQESTKQASSCTWGMDDTEPEEISSENPFALNTEPENEHLYIQDPKKALRGFFEREGHDLPEYDVVEEGHGRYKCRVELPIYGSLGEPIVAEVSVSGKKREAVASCALEACRILDRHGELRKSTHESRAKKRKNWEENDFYDSDEDTFLDRTGDIEKKRKMRMQREKKSSDKVETYESLMKKLTEVEKQINELEEKLEADKKQAAQMDDDGLDAFDAYMNALKSGALDTKTKTKLKRQIFDLKQEKMHLEKLANIAKPALPGMKKKPSSLSKFGAMFGKMKGPAKPDSKSKIPPRSKIVSHQSLLSDDRMEEEEEEEEEMKEALDVETTRSTTEGTLGTTETTRSTTEGTLGTAETTRSATEGTLGTAETTRSTTNGTLGTTETTCSTTEGTLGTAETTRSTTDGTLGTAGETTGTVERITEVSLSDNTAVDIAVTDTPEKDTDNAPCEQDGVASKPVCPNNRTKNEQKDLDVHSSVQLMDTNSDVQMVTQSSVQESMDNPGQGSSCHTSNSSQDEVSKATSESREIHQSQSSSQTKPHRKSKQRHSKTSKAPVDPDLYQSVGEDPDYDMWMPPQGQTGDGKTHLNAKFGY